MSDQILKLGFPGLSPAAASQAAADLEDQINRVLREEGLPEAARQHRTDPSHQDMGTMVQVILAAPATVTFAGGIALAIQKYLARINRGRIEVTRADGTTIEISDIESRDAPRIISALGLKDGG